MDLTNPLKWFPSTEFLEVPDCVAPSGLSGLHVRYDGKGSIAKKVIA